MRRVFPMPVAMEQVNEGKFRPKLLSEGTTSRAFASSSAKNAFCPSWSVGRLLRLSLSVISAITPKHCARGSRIERRFLTCLSVSFLSFLLIIFFVLRFYFRQGNDVEVIALGRIEGTATEEHAWYLLHRDTRETTTHPHCMRGATDE